MSFGTLIADGPAPSHLHRRPESIQENEGGLAHQDFFSSAAASVGNGGVRGAILIRRLGFLNVESKHGA